MMILKSTGWFAEVEQSRAQICQRVGRNVVVIVSDGMGSYTGGATAK